jgi:uncharacterized membrane protein
VVPLARIMRLASVVICLIVGISFALFAINKTSGAAAHQEALVNQESAPAAAAGVSGSRSSSAHKSSLRSDIDDAANKLTSPFAGIVSDTDSQWTIRTVKLLLTLAVYGFGLGFLARMLRVGA